MHLWHGEKELERKKFIKEFSWYCLTSCFMVLRKFIFIFFSRFECEHYQNTADLHVGCSVAAAAATLVGVELKNGKLVINFPSPTAKTVM